MAVTRAPRWPLISRSNPNNDRRYELSSADETFCNLNNDGSCPISITVHCSAIMPLLCSSVAVPANAALSLSPWPAAPLQPFSRYGDLPPPPRVSYKLVSMHSTNLTLLNLDLTSTLTFRKNHSNPTPNPNPNPSRDPNPTLTLTLPLPPA